MIIDAHHHIWQYDPMRHDWIDNSMKVIRRDFSPEDLENNATAQGVTGSVLVQVEQTEQETLDFIETAKQSNFIKGVVGWADLQSANISERLEKYNQFTELKGFRHIVQGEPNDRFMLTSAFMKGISQLELFGFTYDILIFPHQLPAAIELVKAFPNQQFVLDHMAKPPIKTGKIHNWKKDIQALARNENVYCKISGMITEADHQNWFYKQLEPYMDVVFEAFGTSRIMFGSDWPVCNVAGSYAEVLEIVKTYISRFSDEEQKNVLGNNAIRFYNLD
jgi:L-fuconolactonase